MDQMPVKLIAALIAVVLAIVLFLSTFFSVAAYERTVVTRFGDVERIADPGLHFKMPFVNSTHAYRTDIQSLTNTKPANTYTIDNQEIDIIFTVFYRIAPDRVEFVYRNAQDYDSRLSEVVQDRLKAAMGKVHVESVAEKRAEIRDQIKATLTKDAEQLGLTVTDFQLTNLEYTKSFRDAVEQAAKAKAGVQTREQERIQAEKVAQTAKIKAIGEADAAREKGRGDADARLLVATAEAKSIQLKGEAEARAIEAQAKALAANVNLTELRKAEKWNGALPTQMLSGIVPFMKFDAPATKP